MPALPLYGIPNAYRTFRGFPGRGLYHRLKTVWGSGAMKTLITAIAERDHKARKEDAQFARPMRASYKAASRAVRIRRNGYAARTWILGCGENTPLLAELASGTRRFV